MNILQFYIFSLQQTRMRVTGSFSFLFFLFELLVRDEVASWEGVVAVGSMAYGSQSFSVGPLGLLEPGLPGGAVEPDRQSSPARRSLGHVTQPS